MRTSENRKARPSKTAELVAAARAEHIRTVETPLFEDRYAFDMCGRIWRTILSNRLLSQLIIYGLLRKLRPIIPAILRG